MRYYAVLYSDNYLEHHGILGQKWGKKNGPPYPLGASDHSAAEKKAGWRASLKSNIKAKVNKVKAAGKQLRKDIAKKAVYSSLYRKAERNIINPAKNEIYKPLKREWDSLDEEDKRLIKAGLALAGTALVAYGAYRVYKSNNAIEFVKPTAENLSKITLDQALKSIGPMSKVIGEDEIRDAIKQVNEEGYKDLADLKITSPSQLKHWDSAPSIDTLSKSINPTLIKEFHGKDPEKLSLREKLRIMTDQKLQPFTTNCMYCTTAYDLNRRGYKVCANSRTAGGNIEQLGKMYKLKDDIMRFDTKYGNVNKYLKKFSEMEDGARGNMLVQFKAGGGHSVAWEVVDHKLNIIDCQTGQKYTSSSQIKKFMSSVTGQVDTVRTDNADIIWSDMMLRSLDQMD